MKVLIVAGGTGGHFYPGLAVARSLQRRKHDVHFVVRKNDAAAPVLIREKIPFKSIFSAGFRRSLHPSNGVSLLLLGVGFFQSLLLLLKIRPKAVVLMGGYLSVPPGLAAWLLNIPITFHEQNVVPGLAGRIIRPLTTRVCLSFPSQRTKNWKHVRFTGNPVRPEFSRLPDPAESRTSFGLDPRLTTLLVFGGSQGARFLNTAMKDLVATLDQTLPPFQVLHLAGAADAELMKEIYAKASLSNCVLAFCHDMPSAYAAGDFIVCRSGAGTISELIAVKRPALLIPYPFATALHQHENARILENAGAADVMDQKDLTPDKLKIYLSALFRDPEKLAGMRKAYDAIDQKPLEAADRIADNVEEVMQL